MITESKIIRQLMDEIGNDQMSDVGNYIYIEISRGGRNETEFTRMSKIDYDEILSYAIDDKDLNYYQIRDTNIGQVISDDESDYLKIKI